MAAQRAADRALLIHRGKLQRRTAPQMMTMFHRERGSGRFGQGWACEVAEEEAVACGDGEVWGACGHGWRDAAGGAGSDDEEDRARKPEAESADAVMILKCLLLRGVVRRWMALRRWMLASPTLMLNFETPGAVGTASKEPAVSFRMTSASPAPTPAVPSDRLSGRVGDGRSVAGWGQRVLCIEGESVSGTGTGTAQPEICGWRWHVRAKGVCGRLRRVVAAVATATRAG